MNDEQTGMKPETTETESTPTTPISEQVGSTALFADYCPFCPFKGQTYVANLQQAIEYHCRGEVIPEALAKRCPHHAKMLNADLKKQLDEVGKDQPTSSSMV